MSATIGMLSCIVCDRHFEAAANDPHFDTVPYAGTLFYTSGHYGSTVFDSFGREKLEIVVCDKCLVERWKRVALIGGLHRAPWSDASGMSASGQDPKGLEAKPASPVGDSRDAQPPSGDSHA